MKHRLALLALALLSGAAALLVPLGASHAATPGAGTVSDASRSLVWTGALMAPNPNGCSPTDGSTCDLYKLTVDPPGYPFMVRIKLQPVGDWDLSVYGPNDGLAGSSGNGPNQTEYVTLVNPAAGTYTVAAAPFAPAVGPDGNSYVAGADLIPITAPVQPPAGSEPLTFHDYLSPNRTDAGEPSIGANWKSGNTMFQASLTALRVTWDDSVSPANAAWRDVTFPTAGTASLDPIGWMDRQTGRWFSSQLSGTTSLAASTDDDGETWLPSEGGPLNGGVDHQTIGGGPYAAPLTGLVYPDAVYYCSQDLVAALCARSDDGGTTFNPAVPIYTDQCGGLHGHVQVAPDGTVYVPNKNCGGAQGVAVSEDNGLTWSIRTVPGSLNGDWDPAVGVGAKNTVYFGYGDGDGHPKVAVSHDRGATWTVRDVGLPFGIQHTAFSSVVAGDDERAAYAFLGSTEPSSGAFGDDPSWPGVWHLYVAETFDGGDTWTTVDATPDDPVQRGTICAGGTLGCSNGTRNLLDFMGITVDKEGRVLVGYADGCLDACVVTGPNSFTAAASIARQVNGRRLFAQYDVQAAPAAPNLSGKSGGTSNVLSWSAPDDHGSPITGYRLYRKVSGASSYTLLASPDAAATTYSDSALTAGQSYVYRLTAVNAVGESAPSNEVTPASSGPAPDPCVAPGVQVLVDPTGDESTGDPSRDLQWVSVAEPPSIGAGNIEFVIKVADLSKPATATYWPLQFKTPDKADHFVRMAVDALGQVTFGYGDGTATTGTAKAADPQSNYTTDGTIRIVVPRSAFGLNPGDTIGSFLIRVSVGGVAVSLTPDNAPDSLTPAGEYAVKGNENCSTPQADLAVSGSDLGITGLKGAGNDQVLSVVVHNEGTAPASSVKVRFAVDGVQVGADQTIGQILPGGVGRATVTWDTHGQNGTHTLTVTADPANAISERSESNNAGSRLIVVQGSKVALQ